MEELSLTESRVGPSQVRLRMSGTQAEAPLSLIPDRSGFPQVRNPTVGENRLANNVEEVILGPLADLGESLDRERERLAPADLHVFSENEE